MRRKSKSNSGFGLMELLVGSLLLAIVMLGAYQWMSRTTRVTTRVAERTGLLKIADQLETKIKRALRNSGYNPDLIPYAVNPEDPASPSTYDPAVASTWDPDRHEFRVGITYAGLTKIEWTSDDNSLVDPTEANARPGRIQPAERYSIFLAGDDPQDEGEILAAATDIGGRITVAKDESDEPCQGTFENTYRMYRMARDVDEAAWYDADTVPKVLYDKVACLEFRYYTWDLPEQQVTFGKGEWARMFLPGQITNDGNPAYVYEFPTAPTPYGVLPTEVRSHASAAAEISWYAGNETATVTYLGMTHIHRVKIGMILLGEEVLSGEVGTKGELRRLRRVFDVRLGNWAWSKSILPVPAPKS